MDGDSRFKPQKDINRVRGSIKKLEKQKERMFPGLGLSTYQVFLAGKLDEGGLVEQCGAIQAIDIQVQQALSRISELQTLAQRQAAAPAAFVSSACPQCGSPLGPGARFCPNCGMVQQQAPTCPNCGAAVTPGTRFCGGCGGAIQAAPAPRAESAPAAEPKKCGTCGVPVEEGDSAFCGECGNRLIP